MLMLRTRGIATLKKKKVRVLIKEASMVGVKVSITNRIKKTR